MLLWNILWNRKEITKPKIGDHKQYYQFQKHYQSFILLIIEPEKEFTIFVFFYFFLFCQSINSTGNRRNFGINKIKKIKKVNKRNNFWWNIWQVSRRILFEVLLFFVPAERPLWRIFWTGVENKIKKKKVAHGGIEPTTFALLARRSNQLS